MVVATRPKPMPAEGPAISRNGFGGSGAPCAHSRPRPVSSVTRHAMTRRMHVDSAVRTRFIKSLLIPRPRRYGAASSAIRRWNPRRMRGKFRLSREEKQGGEEEERGTGAPVSGAPAWHDRLLHDLPAEHHRVILVRQVVAVRHVGPEERAEVPEEIDGLTRSERNHVFARLVIGMRAIEGSGHAIARDDAMLLHVQVERMDPAAAAVADRPDLRHALLRERQGHGGVEREPVDQPFDLAAELAAALELERARRRARHDERIE